MLKRHFRQASGISTISWVNWRELREKNRPTTGSSPCFRCAEYLHSNLLFASRLFGTKSTLWKSKDLNYNIPFALFSTGSRSVRNTKHQTQTSGEEQDMDGIDSKRRVPNPNATPVTVAVEGNIGSGKSTLLKHFEKLPFCEVIGEPLDQWTNLEGHNALGLLYENQERWSFSFNMYAQLTRVDMHLKPQTRPVKMLERSLFSTRYCFVQNDYLNETITGFEFSVLSQWFDYLVDNGKAKVDLIVYLRADPSTCYERIKKRSRKEESCVPKSLIDSLHKLHDEWLLEEKYPVPAPVLVLDANSELDEMIEIYNLRQQEIVCGYR